MPKDGIEVLASRDECSEGTLKSNLYGIELQLPVSQMIDVRILPALDLLGHVTEDGSVLLPPIVQCDTPGEIDISKGPLVLKFKIYDSDTAVHGFNIWHRVRSDAEWQLLTSTVDYDAQSRTGTVSTQLKHFCHFALAASLDETDDDYIQKTVAEVFIVDSFRQRVLNKHPCAGQKFIGNLTASRVEILARAAYDTNNSNRREGSVNVTPSFAGNSAGGIALTHERTQVAASHLYTTSYSMPPCSRVPQVQSAAAITPPPQRAPLMTVQSPPQRYRIPIVTVHDSDASTAEIALYTDSDNGTRIRVWDKKSLVAGTVLVMCPARIKAGRRVVYGVHNADAEANVSQIVQNAVGWGPSAITPSTTPRTA
eukprot:18744-Heterococcus_DN1.PRE.5